MIFFPNPTYLHPLPLGEGRAQDGVRVRSIEHGAASPPIPPVPARDHLSPMPDHLPTPSEPPPRPPTHRLTTSHLLVLVALCALAFWIVRLAGLLGILLLADLAAAAVVWAFLRRSPTVAVLYVFVTGVLAVLLPIALTICYPGILGEIFTVLALAILLPLLVGAALAWSLAAADRPRTLARLSLGLACALSPLATLATDWPLRVAFLASRPSFEHLADRLTLGLPTPFPSRAGCFLVRSATLYPSTGHISFDIASTPAAFSGFVRRSPSNPNTPGPIVNLSDRIIVADGWSYETSD